MVQGRRRSKADFHTTSPYEIRIHGELDERWSEWFSGIRIHVESSEVGPPQTTLQCPPMDQSRLRGIMNKLWDLNLSIFSVIRLEDQEFDNSGIPIQTGE
jgi:hypothetical protein